MEDDTLDFLNQQEEAEPEETEAKPCYNAVFYCESDEPASWIVTIQDDNVEKGFIEQYLCEDCKNDWVGHPQLLNARKIR